MNIDVGVKVILSHYSKSIETMGIVIKIDENSLLLNICEDNAKEILSLGESVVLVYKINEDVFITPGIITNTCSKSKNIEVAIDEYKCITNKRKVERIPVSILCDVEIEGNQEKINTILTDIGIHGVKARLKNNLPNDKELVLHVPVKEGTTLITAIVIRKTQKGDNFEYGLQFNSLDEAYLKGINDLIQDLIDDQMLKATRLN